jgi:hypothetical protein
MIVYGYNTNAVEDKDRKKCFNDLQWHDLATECNENWDFLISRRVEIVIYIVIHFINEPSYIKVSGKHIYVYMTYSTSSCLCDTHVSIDYVCMYVC